ncbi:hypothetical protein SKAU_G00417550 [Synaphobranchus kaupii]|uniref:Uncharacterized protein n=1 Tax=Synaphobranchus kaupii TaxID=118154 RepID=A0A9Q1E603_SYNKA|nr:hypothetical protein SKAU_G00417550 [Synaphobranchus kaupii]
MANFFARLQCISQLLLFLFVLAIRCEKCLDDGCTNVTKVWRSQNGNDRKVWSRKNAIPECTFSPPPETWYHVCKKNNSVFMVTNDSAPGVTFRFEAAGQHLNSERKSGKECPKLEPDPDQPANNTRPTKSPSTPQGWIPVVFVLVSFLPPLLIGICCKMKSNPKCCPRACEYC